MRTRTLRSMVYFGGGFGLIASLYAAGEVYDAELSKACSVNGVVSCNLILESGKTTVLGIPDWSVGVAGFVLILILGVLAERYRKELHWTYLLGLVTTVGVAFSLYFLYVEVFEIGGICPVCVTAYIFGWLACAGALGLVQRAYRKGHPTPDSAPSAA